MLDCWNPSLHGSEDNSNGVMFRVFFHDFTQRLNAIIAARSLLLTVYILAQVYGGRIVKHDSQLVDKLVNRFSTFRMGWERFY